MVKGKSFKVGRDEISCALVLDKDLIEEIYFDKISRVHFEITKDINDWNRSPTCITDRSLNGTWINGSLLGIGNTKILQHKDSIAIVNQKYIIFEYRETFNRSHDLPEIITSKYFVQTKLGSGAFVEVFKVLSIENVEKFAMKHIKMKTMSTVKKTKDESLNEAGIMRSLNHPCIVRLIDILSTDLLSTSLIMEFMPGGDLLHRITNSPNLYLSEDVCRNFMYQITSALQYLHSRKITHRDIKPDNVLLKDESDFTIAKLSDFGLSKFVGNETVLKSLIGTPNYVAPEVLKSRVLGKYESVVDVWSLGVLLFACLSGTLPFADEDKGTLENQITNARFSFSSKCWKAVTSTPKRLIKKMLVVDPKKRITIDEILSNDWLSEYHPIIKNTKLSMEREREKIDERLSDQTLNTNDFEKENTMRVQIEESPRKRRKLE